MQTKKENQGLSSTALRKISETVNLKNIMRKSARHWRWLTKSTGCGKRKPDPTAIGEVNGDEPAGCIAHREGGV